MIDINIYNYESYLLDYFEGKLSYTQKDKVLSFIYSNPELINEFENYNKNKSFIPEAIKFPNKKELIKEPLLSEQISNFDELCIAKLEGDLSENEHIQFILLLKEKFNLNSEYNKFKKTIFLPDLSVRYENKGLLKQKTVVDFSRNYSFYKYLIASSIVIFFTILLFMPQNDKFNHIDQVAINSLTIKKNKQIVNLSEQNIDVKIIELKKNINTINTKEYNNITKVKGNKETEIIINNNVDREKEENVTPLIPVNVEIDNIKANNVNSLYKIIKSKKRELQNIQNEESSVKEFVTKKINQKIFNNEFKLNKFSGWDIAQIGIKGINRITGSNIQLNKKYNNQGKISKVEFNSKLIAFSSSVKK